MLSTQQLSRTCLLAIILLVTSSRSLAAADMDDRAEFMSLLAGWQMMMSAHQLKNYLSYKGSLITSITEVDVNYRTRDRQTGEWMPFRKYETLWFSNGQPLGCKRFEQLSIVPQTQGNILIDNSAQATEQMDAIANAVIRTYLDIELKRADCDGVLVANDQFDAMASSLGRYKFYAKRFLTDESGVLLRVVATRGEKEKYFFFRAN